MHPDHVPGQRQTGKPKARSMARQGELLRLQMAQLWAASRSGCALRPGRQNGGYARPERNKG